MTIVVIDCRQREGEGRGQSGAVGASERFGRSGASAPPCPLEGHARGRSAIAGRRGVPNRDRPAKRRRSLSSRVRSRNAGTVDYSTTIVGAGFADVADPRRTSEGLWNGPALFAYRGTFSRIRYWCAASSLRVAPADDPISDLVTGDASPPSTARHSASARSATRRKPRAILASDRRVSPARACPCPDAVNHAGVASVLSSSDVRDASAGVAHATGVVLIDAVRVSCRSIFFISGSSDNAVFAASWPLASPRRAPRGGRSRSGRPSAAEGRPAPRRAR